VVFKKFSPHHYELVERTDDRQYEVIESGKVTGGAAESNKTNL
jgi:hypothetical protein